jgi:hypothetical protein
VDESTPQAAAVPAALAEAAGFQVPVVVNPNDEAGLFKTVAKSGNFLPRLQLFGSNSDHVKTETVGIGYALVRAKDDMVELGKETDVLVLSWRPKALDMKAIDDQGKPAIVTSFKPGTELFQKIQKKAAIKNSGAMFGPEFLVFIPSIGEFATFFMGSPTARREAPVVKAYIPNPENQQKGKGKCLCTLTTHLFSNQDFKWHGTRTQDCTTPPANVPTAAEMEQQQRTFLSPPEKEIEAATPEEVAAAGTERAR